MERHYFKFSIKKIFLYFILIFLILWIFNSCIISVLENEVSMTYKSTDNFFDPVLLENKKNDILFTIDGHTRNSFTGVEKLVLFLRVDSVKTQILEIKEIEFRSFDKFFYKYKIKTESLKMSSDSAKKFPYDAGMTLIISISSQDWSRINKASVLRIIYWDQNKEKTDFIDLRIKFRKEFIFPTA